MRPALSKLRSKGGDVEKFVRSDIFAIAYRYPAVDLGGMSIVTALTAALLALITARPHVLTAVILKAAAPQLRCPQRTGLDCRTAQPLFPRSPP